MPKVCFPGQQLDKRTMVNDPFERVGTTSQALISSTATAFEAAYRLSGDPTPSEGERLALRRALARFLIDSGMASAHGEV